MISSLYTVLNAKLDKLSKHDKIFLKSSFDFYWKKVQLLLYGL